MKIYLQFLAFVLLTGGFLILAGCARRTPARVEVVPAEKPTSAAVAVKEPATARSERFAFPADQGGPLLRELLGPPRRLADAAEARPGPRPEPIPNELAHPELPTSRGQADLPRRSLISTRPLQPMSPTELPPLANYRASPQPTNRQEMRSGAPVRIPSRDVTAPPQLPPLGLLTVDRVPLNDPTTEASNQAALAATPPARATPASFVPRNLPDPFENERTIQLRTNPAEPREPDSGPVRPPKN